MDFFVKGYSGSKTRVFGIEKKVKPGQLNEKA
jgi:hypothetical protein